MTLKSVLVKDLMAGKSADVGSISVDATVRDAARVISDMRIGILVIFDANKNFKGLISERDVARVLADHGADAGDVNAVEVATKNVTGCKPDTDLEFVLESMRTKHFRHMPVMEGDRIVGVISMGDILRYLLNERSEFEKQKKKGSVFSKVFGG